MMTLVYSALRPDNEYPNQQIPKSEGEGITELFLRYAGYDAACLKYSAEITAIQKFFPGWLPSQPSGNSISKSFSL